MLFLGERNTIDVKFFKDLLLTIFLNFILNLYQIA